MIQINKQQRIARNRLMDTLAKLKLVNRGNYTYATDIHGNLIDFGITNAEPI